MMEWESPKDPKYKWFLPTKCGRYTVSKGSTNGKVIYAAWNMTEGFPREMLGMRDTFKECAALCREHEGENNG